MKNTQDGRLSDDDEGDDEDIPSAPPFCSSGQEIKQTSENIAASKAHAAPHNAGLREFSTGNEFTTHKSVSQDKIENSIGNENPDQFVRLVYLTRTSMSRNLSSLPCKKYTEFLVKQT